MSAIVLATGSLLLAFSAPGTVIVREAIPAGEIVTAGALEEAGEASDALIGREVVRAVYAGEALKPQNTRAPRVIRRNAMVTIKYIQGPLEIEVSGRALSEAAAGESVTVMNVQSREAVQGIAQAEGWVRAQ